jgi:hypothetical protein
MKSMIGAALLAVGIVLLVLGIGAAGSVGSQVSETFRGTPSDRAVWFIVGGIACAVGGLFGLYLGGRGGRSTA